MLLLIPSVNKKNKQIRQLPMEGKSFSRDWNYTMTTTVYLKNEILLPSLPLMPRQLVHCKLIELEQITLQCLMLNPTLRWVNWSTNKLYCVWTFGLGRPSIPQDARWEIDIIVEPYKPHLRATAIPNVKAAAEKSTCRCIDEFSSIVV